MSMIDANEVLSDAQAITTTAGSTSYYDAAAAGAGVRDVWVEFLINTTFTSNGATVQFDLQCDDNTSFSSAKTLFSSGAIAVATLVAGYVVARVRIPIGAERYLRAYYTVASGPAAAGKIDCRFLLDTEIRA